MTDDKDLIAECAEVLLDVRNSRDIPTSRRCKIDALLAKLPKPKPKLDEATLLTRKVLAAHEGPRETATKANILKGVHDDKSWFERTRTVIRKALVKRKDVPESIHRMAVGVRANNYTPKMAEALAGYILGDRT